MGARLSMIGLLVEDMERSLGFYRALGLEIPEGTEEEPHVEIEIGGGLVLFWDATFAGTYDSHREEPNGGYRILPEFFVGSEEAVDALYGKLVAERLPRAQAAVRDALRGVHGDGRRPGRQHRPTHGRLVRFEETPNVGPKMGADLVDLRDAPGTGGTTLAFAPNALGWSNLPGAFARTTRPSQKTTPWGQTLAYVRDPDWVPVKIGDEVPG